MKPEQAQPRLAPEYRVQLQTQGPASDNHRVKRKATSTGKGPAATTTSSAQSGPSFAPGSIVLATLREPREKIWGALLALDPAGVSLHGIELSSFEDATSAVVGGEPFN